MKYQLSIQEKLKDLRVEKGLSLEELAAETDARWYIDYARFIIYIIQVKLCSFMSIIYYT